MRWIGEQPGSRGHLFLRNGKLIVEGMLRVDQIQNLKQAGASGELLDRLRSCYLTQPNESSTGTKGTTSRIPVEIAGGTGGRAARNLSQMLPNSDVIKVSASGSLKFFRCGKLQEHHPRA